MGNFKEGVYEEEKMTKKLKLKWGATFASIFHDPKWLGNIKIEGFSSRRAKDNHKILNKITKLVEEYKSKKRKIKINFVENTIIKIKKYKVDVTNAH